MEYWGLLFQYSNTPLLQYSLPLRMRGLAMECKNCEEMLTAYACGDLAAEEAAAVERHVGECTGCRETLEGCRAVIGSIADESIISPTAAESAALAGALARVRLGRQPSREMMAVPAKGLLGFALATLAAFVLIALVLGLQAFGHVDIVWMIGSVNPIWIAAAAVLVVFVTSFIPIWVTARRRPLNGLTFSR